MRNGFLALFSIVLVVGLAACNTRAKHALEQARAADTPAAYEQFLRNFPDNPLTPQAKTRIEELYRKRVLFPAMRDKKAGYIDASGQFVIKPAYDDARMFRENAALVRVQEKWGFVDKGGRALTRPEYKQIEDFSEGLAAVQAGDKWGFIDSTGRMAIPPRFDDAWPFSEGLALVKISGKWGFVDHAGKLVIPATYECGFVAEFARLELSVGPDGKLREVVDLGRDGGLAVKSPIEWLTRESFGFGSAWMYPSDATKQGGMYTPDVVVDAFSGGFARLMRNGKWGFIDKTGKTAIEPRYQYCTRFHDGRAAVHAENGIGFVDTHGQMIIQPAYPAVHTHFAEGLVGVQKNGQWGFLDPDGQVKIAFRFADAHAFSGGLAAVKLKGKWGFVDNTGNLAIPAQFDDAADFAEGLAAVAKNKKWGYVDKTGAQIVQLQYDSVEPFQDGLAQVRAGAKSSWVSRAGTVVWTSQ